MNTATFDTHAAVKALTRAGVAAEQAEAITDTVRVAVSEGVATKADLDTGLAALDAKIAALKADLYRALWIQGAGLVAVMVALRLFG